MQVEAAGAGFHESKTWNKSYPRLQIFTVEQLLDGRQVDRPPTVTFDETYKHAPKSPAEGPAPAGTRVVSAQQEWK